MVWSDQVFADEIRPEWKKALSGIIAGKPDRTDLMISPHLNASDRSRLTSREVIDAIIQETGVSWKALMGRNRRQSWCRARHLMVYVANRTFPHKSDSELGRMFGRDTTTILNSMRRAAHLRETNEVFQLQYEHVMTALGLDAQG